MSLPEDARARVPETGDTRGRGKITMHYFGIQILVHKTSRREVNERVSVREAQCKTRTNVKRRSAQA